MTAILDILQSEYLTEYYSMKPYTDPLIYHGGKDFNLSKRWYVYYSYINPETGEMTRQPPIYMNINREYKTKKERLEKLRAIQKGLLKLLKLGHSPYVVEPEPKQYTIVKALDFAFNIKKNELSATSYPDYESKKKGFIKYLEREGLNFSLVGDIKKKDVLNYLNEISEKSTAKTRNNHQVVLSSFFTVLKENEIISDNFIREISQQKTRSVRHKTYSKKQLEALEKEISKDEKLKFFIAFVSYNFLRPIEVVRLKWKDLKIDEEIPYLEVKAKNKPLKKKTIPEILLNELKKYKQGKPDEYVFMTNNKGIETTEVNRRNYFSDRFSKIKKKLNLSEEYTMYSFRHTYITKLFREIRKTRTEIETYDLLMRITGHTTLIALKSYLRDIDAELAEDYSKFLK